MLDISTLYAQSGIENRLIPLPASSSALTSENPLLHGITSRIRDASLPLEKKKELISMVWNIFKEASDNGSTISAETIKKLYAIVDVMELTEHYHLKPGELQMQQKKIEEMLSHYIGQHPKEEHYAVTGPIDRSAKIDITA